MATQRIGIVGAGPAGLAALKAILDTPQYKAGLWAATAFEARENVGGVWLPSPPSRPTPGDNPPTPLPATPLYDSLTTNLPHPIMAFSSFPFPASTPLFPKADIVQTYLEAYTTSFDLHKHILLNTRVINADWDPEQSKWVIEASKAGQSSKWTFNLLLVCNGHYNVPRYPLIPGLSIWLSEGRASHSMYYRNPSSIPSFDPKHELKDQMILVIGGGPSGSDITAELVPLAGRVLHSFSANSGAARAASSSSQSSTPPPDVETLPDPVPSKEAAGAIPKPRVSSFADGRTVLFEDGSEETNVDYCIVATGYEVDFSFFASSPGSSSTRSIASSPKISISKGLIPYFPPNTTHLPETELLNTSWGVFPLARHLFGVPSCGFSKSGSSSPSQLPSPTSLAFLGLLVRVAPLPLVEAQARAALAAFAVGSASSEHHHSSPASSIDWPHEVRKIFERWQELQARFEALESSNSTTATITTSNGASSNSDQEKLRTFISREWHRFSQEMRQFDYRDDLDDLAFSLRTSSPPHIRVKPWERYFYTHKLTLRKAWRELEARGLAEEWVRDVGSGELELPPADGGEDGGERKTHEERAEAEWVWLMERVLEFGKSL